MDAWYLIFCKPLRERVALENLERQGYHAYLPLMRARKRRKSRYVQVIEPMFPRYLFVHLNDHTDNWAPIRSTLGVANLVRFGTEAARVPDSLVVALRAREDAQGVQSLPVPTFRQGDRVRIAEGAMAGYEAIFQARSSKERVVLLLEVAGKLARVHVAEGDIEPVTPNWSLPRR